MPYKDPLKKKTWYLKWKKLYPWKKIYRQIYDRCNYKTCGSYKYYGGKGIKCSITVDELKKLWFRDKAYDMKKPSIDRKNNKNHYTFKNCRFIELSINVGKDKRKPIIQLDKNKKFIKEWKYCREASKVLNINSGDIYACALGLANVKSAGGFIWRYKDD